MEENIQEEYIVHLRQLHLPQKLEAVVETGNRILIQGEKGGLWGALIPVEDLMVLEEFDEAQERMDAQAVGAASKDEVEDWEAVKENI